MGKKQEPRVGEVFEHNGVSYRCEIDDGPGACGGCAFVWDDKDCLLFNCNMDSRRDRNIVHFKKIDSGRSRDIRSLRSQTPSKKGFRAFMRQLFFQR